MEEDLKLEQYQLGETNEELACIGEENNRQVTVAMIQQTEFYLDILSHYFDAEVYDNQECCDAIEALALRSRYSRIRILLHDSKRPGQQGHCVMQLAKRLGSLIQCRTMAEVHKHIQDTWLLADGIGYIHRPYADTLTATVNFKDRVTVKKLAELFDKLWLDGEVDLETRYLVV
jgi:hypothetical protein